MLAREPNYCLNNLWYFMVYLYSAEWEFFFFSFFWDQRSFLKKVIRERGEKVIVESPMRRHAGTVMQYWDTFDGYRQTICQHPDLSNQITPVNANRYIFIEIATMKM